MGPLTLLQVVVQPLLTLLQQLDRVADLLDPAIELRDRRHQPPNPFGLIERADGATFSVERFQQASSFLFQICEPSSAVDARHPYCDDQATHELRDPMYRRAALHYARYERGERYRLLGGVMRPRGIPLALWQKMLWVEQIEDGDAERKFRIAMRLKDGDGLPEMPRLAYRWLLDVSGARHPAARYELAVWQLEEGLPFADERFANFLAIDRLRWAAFYGYPPALVEYGTRLAQGRDVERNDCGAYIVLLRAKKAGMQVDDRLARLERTLPADDIALAREHFEDRHFFPFGIHDGDY